MKWITREKPKIDRIACPWLIKRFIDKEAEFIYAPANKVIQLSEELSATPFDIAGVEYAHHGEQCTFDYFIEKYEITDPALHTMAVIVRGADTDRHEIAPQASGLWAISAGLAHNVKDDFKLLEMGMVLYDALYSWASYHKDARHTNQPDEALLLNIFHRFIASKDSRKKPAWVQELKDMIQDQIDSSITLKALSRDLDINPSYLSRTFAKHFDDMSFGEYIRKQRISKAIKLMQEKYSLTEIAYLTGFSDQSHFTRIFKQQTGQNPSVYRKSLLKK